MSKITGLWATSDPSKKIFGGRRYDLMSIWTTKAEAQKEARRLKTHLYHKWAHKTAKVRVVKSVTKGYAVYAI
jgi:hypothetical protein